MTGPLWSLLDSPVIVADCVEAMAAMPANSVDSICTDPPYLLGFMGKEFDSQHRGFRRAENLADAGRDDVFGRTSRTSPEYVGEGRAMQEWHERWAREALRVLRPGGHLLAFGGSRTSHRLACAIEDAGFEIRDSILWAAGGGATESGQLDWIYGSG